jgi:precorrin-6B methylase 2
MQLSSIETRYSKNFSFIKGNHEAMNLENYGEYKQKEINLLALLLSNNVGNTVVYDVGAGIGTRTIALSMMSAVVAFEHNEDKLKVLKMNTQGKLAPNVMIVPKSLETTDPHDKDIPNLDGQLMKLPEPSMVCISGDSTPILRGMTATMMLIKPVIYIDIENAEDISYQYSILKERGYEMYWYKCDDYNVNNFKQNTFDTTLDSFHMNILAIHEDVEINDGGIDLPRIDGPNDNWTIIKDD